MNRLRGKPLDASQVCIVAGISLAFVLVILPVLNSPAYADIAIYDVAGEPLTLSGWMRTREYVWSFFQAGPIRGKEYENRYDYQANVLRLGLGYRLAGLKFFAELMDPALFDLPSNAIAPAPAGLLGLGANYYQPHQNGLDASVFLKQGYVEFGDQILKGLDIKGGRFEFFDGQELIPENDQLRWIALKEISQRLVANFGFSDVMRSFDGAAVRYGNRQWNITAMYGVPTRGAFDLSGMDEIPKIDLDYTALNGQSTHRWGDVLGRAFFIWYDDNRGLVPVDNQPVKVAATNLRPISIETFGADSATTFHVGPGTADAMLWGALQVGSWGAQTQRGWAAVAQFGYRFDKEPWKPWFRAGYQVSSGDSEPSDGTHGTFFQILPTPRLYALTPIYNMMNNIDASTEIILAPLENVDSRTTLHALWLSASRDLWYTGGGAFDSHIFGYSGRPSFGRSYLGMELDTGLTWRIGKYLSVSLFAGHFFGGSVVAASFPQGRGETFGYAESVISF